MPLVTVNINASNDSARLPLVWRLGRKFNVVTNVRRARVSADFAYVALDVEGSTQEVEQATGYLRGLGVTEGAGTALVPREVYGTRRHRFQRQYDLCAPGRREPRAVRNTDPVSRRQGLQRRSQYLRGGVR